MKYLVGSKVINAENITFVFRTESGKVKVYTTDSDQTWIEFTDDEADRFWAIYSADAIDVMAGEAA